MAFLPVPIIPASASTYFYDDFIWIHPDGSIEGMSGMQRDGDVYTLTSDISCNLGDLAGFLLVQKNNIVIDGAGHTVKGSNGGTAIYLRGAQNATIQNFNIEGFVIGVTFYVTDPPSPGSNWPVREPAQNNKIINNNITTVFPEGLSHL